MGVVGNHNPVVGVGANRRGLEERGHSQEEELLWTGIRLVAGRRAADSRPAGFDAGAAAGIRLDLAGRHTGTTSLVSRILTLMWV